MTDAMQVDLSCEAGTLETVLQFRQETAAEARTRKAKRRQELREELQVWLELLANGYFAQRKTRKSVWWWRTIPPKTYAKARARIEAMGLRPRDETQSADYSHAERLLACALLAAMAEDELKALPPVSRPSSLRRPRQHKRGK